MKKSILYPDGPVALGIEAKSWGCFCFSTNNYWKPVFAVLPTYKPGERVNVTKIELGTVLVHEGRLPLQHLKDLTSHILEGLVISPRRILRFCVENDGAAYVDCDLMLAIEEVE